MKRTYIFIAGMLIFEMAFPQKFEANWSSLNTRKIPGWFQEDKFGIFIHWGIYAVPAYAPVIPNSGYSYAEWYWYRIHEKQKDFKAFHDKSYGADFQYPQFLNRNSKLNYSIQTSGPMRSKNLVHATSC